MSSVATEPPGFSRPAAWLWLLAGTACAALAAALSSETATTLLLAQLDRTRADVSAEGWLRLSHARLLTGAFGVALILSGSLELRRREPLGTAPFWSARWFHVVVLAAVAALAVWYAAGNTASGYDELIYLINGRALLGEDLPYRAGRPPLVPVLTIFLGVHVSFVNALAYTTMVVLAFVWARRLGRAAHVAMLAAAIVVASDKLRFYLMDARPMMISAACMMLALECVYRRWSLATGVAVALAVLGRWEYGGVFLLLAFVVLRRDGWRALLIFALPAAVLGLPYAIWSQIHLGSPLAGPASLLGQNTASVSVVPSVWSRTLAYWQASYHLTALPLIAILVWVGQLLLRASSRSGDRPRIDLADFRALAALVVLAYALPLHLLSIPLARYCLPVLPIAAVASVDLLSWMPRHPATARLIALLTLVLLSIPLMSAAQRQIEAESCQQGLVDLRSAADAEAEPGERVYSRLTNTLVTYHLRRRVIGVGVTGAPRAADHEGGCLALPELGRHVMWLFEDPEIRASIEPAELPRGALLVTRKSSVGQVIARAGELLLVRVAR